MSDEPTPRWREPVFTDGAPVAPPPGTSSADPDQDGPPPPPWVRRRARRRRALTLVVAAVALLALPVVLITTGLFDGRAGLPEQPTDAAGPDDAPDRPGADDDPGDEDDEGSGDAGFELDPPDPAAHTGSDADFAALLAGVEASERAMLHFQREVATAFAGDTSAAERGTTIRRVAAAGAQDLDAARDTLSAPLTTAGAERVRVLYLEHLESWHALMADAAEDPTLLGPAGDTARYNRVINATALAFARALEAELPDDAAPEIVDYADDLLDRGFRFDADAQV